MRRRTLLCGVAMGTAAVMGPVNATPTDTGDEERDEEEEAVLGELVEGDNFHLVVESVSKTSSLDEFIEADEGNEFLVVRLAYKNISDEFHSVSGWLSTRVRDDEAYNYDQNLFGTGEALNDGQIAPGEVERGDVVYEVPDDASGFVLEFDFDPGLFGDLDRVTIDLEDESDDPHVLEQALEVDVYSIGDTVEYEDTSVTVNELETETQLDDFTEAEEGYEYAIVDITVANDTGEEHRVSTVLQMQVKDEKGVSYGEDLGGSVALDRGFDEGTPIAHADERRGQLAYEVEEGLEPLYWVFEFSLFAEGEKTFWQLR